MVKDFIRRTVAMIAGIVITNTCIAQNSLLINFGTNSCSGSGEPAFSLIKNPFTDTAGSLTTCSVAAQVPDIFAVFIAYNPKANKLYLADIRTGNTKIWALDIGLPQNIECPPALEAAPDTTYSYVSNNFEFDNNGDLWSFSNYNPTIGQCNMDKFDLHTGTVINTRVLQFPTGNFPTSITSGDLTILPNGRMFATLGSDSSKLYEILNYGSTTTDATAIYLTTLPQNCFGIAYLNGKLEITGTGFFGNCYYYKYDITSNVLDSVVPFQDGQLPIDNTSITPSLGVTKQLVSAQKVNVNTADLTYEIYVRNLGNVALNNINVSDDLNAVYETGNISNINVTFAPGANSAGLVINPSFNGGSDINLLAPGQNLANQTATNTDYFFKLRLTFRVTNLKALLYNNSAIGSATVGGAGTLSMINVSDSSNDGPQTAVDPNNNGNAGEAGENTPTPFNFATLPVKFVGIRATLLDNSSAMITWSVATPAIASDKFEVEYSTDSRNWNLLQTIPITNPNQSKYEYVHSRPSADILYYRVKETDIDGAFVYSSIAVLRNGEEETRFVIFPNPVNDQLTIYGPASGNGKTQIVLCDAKGRQVISSSVTGSIYHLDFSSLPNGAYIMTIKNDGMLTTRKIIVTHK